MSAIEEAIRPYLRAKAVKQKLTALTRAALPIIAKAALGIGGKAMSRYLGEGFSETAKAEIEAEVQKGANDSLLDAGADAAFGKLSDIVDGVGSAMLEQYRARQKSRLTFKTSLGALAASIDAMDASQTSPIYVIVDELDRCRPSYAIALLEEIKHLFDVPGVIFIIAVHADQLKHSINAVYGANFDSLSYLQEILFA